MYSTHLIALSLFPLSLLLFQTHKQMVTFSDMHTVHIKYVVKYTKNADEQYTSCILSHFWDVPTKMHHKIIGKTLHLV